MTPTPAVTPPAGDHAGISRRRLLGGGAVAAGSALAGGVLGHAWGATSTPATVSADAIPLHGPRREPFHGAHQSGILTGQQAHGSFIGLNLRPGSTREDVVSLLRMLTDDAARLTQGRAPLGALEADIAQLPARLTVTFGFGKGLLDAVGKPQAIPPALASLPAFATDRLRPEWGQTDLVLQICSEEPVTLSYARRRLVRDAAAFTTVAWVQTGFGNAPGTEPAGSTPRNLMGMRDGTANESDPARTASVVWSTDPAYPWLVGGSHLVIRRMAIEMEAWDDIEVAAKEEAFGRRLSDGSPLTGKTEKDPVDRLAKNSDGFPVVNPAAHAARAQPRNEGERMMRRAYNYDVGLTPEGKPDVGLIFVCYQKDVTAAFVPVQQRLAESDLLNLWAHHIGSASYAVPPGAEPGEYIGQRLIEG
ncbi:dye decolorizing peroxidase [Austwickia chelonae]|uniref:Putative peroxidase n=1 Tax=Austwickia chelonae NBRC 105200 TaxID=1184607 RepID=K6W400_9MICO|nr:Dyp-type peroxidase [Austwickia chelonae]GAB76517.1 putative peroxidase [Austwickia chelonae NBRC 105200]SEW26066.1 dye decolorizing peroxidase [Austwickia chelonae]